MAAALPVQLVARAAPDVELSVNGEAGACQIQSPLIYFLAGRIGAVVEAQPANAHGLRVVQLAHFPGASAGHCGPPQHAAARLPHALDSASATHYRMQAASLICVSCW